MAKMLHHSRPSRRLSNIVRTWLAMRRQKRRREARSDAGGAVPAAPSIWLEDRGDFVFVQWDINSTDHLGFRVYRMDVGLIGTVGALSTEWQDYAVVPGNYYAYYVVAYNGAGESAHSNEEGIIFQE